MKDPMIAARDRHYAEEERKMARRDEVERNEEKACKRLLIRYESWYDEGGEERHDAHIIDMDDDEAIAHIPSNDSLEDVIILARSKRDKIAHEMAEKSVKDAEQNQ